MVASAPRIQPRLLGEIERLSARRATIAEINRRVGLVAARLRLYKPSYEQVRVLVHAARRVHRAVRRSRATAAPDIAFGTKTSWALLDRLWRSAEPQHDGRGPPGG